MRNWAWIGLVACVLWIGCGDDNEHDKESEHGDAGGKPSGGLALEVACADAVKAIDEDASGLKGGAGDVLRCAPDGTLSRDELQAKLDGYGWSSRAVTSGVRKYRVLYRTERGDPAKTIATSSALVLLPATPAATPLPVIVASHGSHGQCEACAPSKADPVTQAVRGDFERQVYSLAGYGYAVIAPDLAGYADYGAAGNPAPSYGASEDVGKSTLDGARALRKLIPSALSERIVLVGHSQGGHTALSALALADSYGADGSIAAVALFAPLWLTQRSWGAVTAFASLFPFQGNEGTNAVAIWYHYTRAELVDGAGHGVDVFKADKREQIVDFVKTASWAGTGWDKLHALGETAADVFAPEFASAVGGVAAGNVPSCASDAEAGAVCERWMSRYAADRPHLEGSALAVPILLTWGGKDTTIGPDRVSCAIDRLKGDKASLSVCVDPSADHSSILGTKGGYVADWIAARVSDGPEPAACAEDEGAIVGQNGMLATCNALPPND